MSDIRYIQLKTQDGTSCIPFSVARYLTIALPELSPDYQETTLHLQVRWSLDIISEPLEASDYFDTGARDADRSRLRLFTGNTWILMDSSGFPQTYANCRVIFDTKDIDPDSFIYYSWYYVTNGLAVHVTPWASTKLTATTGIVKHSELQDRARPNQHPIEAITGLSEALSRDYQEVCIKTDADMESIPVSSGKIITFVGYSTGAVGGTVVMRYKTYEGVFGTLTPGISASLEDDNLTLDDGGSNTPDVGVEVAATVTESNMFLQGNAVTVAETSLILDSTECTVEGTNLTIPSI
jgi:hypothetical protein